MSTNGRDHRGIVTVEFAVGILASIIVLTSLAWMIFLFGVRVAAVDTAGAVAREVARGDSAAARTAEQQGPADAHYDVSTEAGLVQVLATVDAAPLAGLPRFRITATAEALPEPTAEAGDR